ncbi:MAG TPA: hypothetical protein VGD64_02205 [Acidisarcina sp.]
MTLIARLSRSPLAAKLCCQPLSLSPSLLLGLLVLSATHAYGQIKTRVTIDATAKGNILFSSSLGVAPDISDGKASDPATISLLRDAGIGIIRYPGNGGAADLYHFSTGAISNPFPSDKPPYMAPENNFPAAAAAIEGIGTAMVTVNYGSNLDGSGGGEPAEAAAWVAYTNGSPDSSVVIGKDSKGNDWKTVGYWAGLRAASPVSPDDGFNALRIGHARPFGIQLWTVGFEPWNNGFYGQDSSGEFDLHGGTVPSKKDLYKHSGDSRYGPTTYGNAVVAYVKTMKAVDPSIFIGASLVPPPPDGNTKVGKNWNGEVLKAACASMDFGAVSLSEGGRTLPPEYKKMDEEDLLMYSVGRDYSNLAKDLGDKYKKFCPPGHAPQLAIVNFGIATWPKIEHPAAEAVFAADAFPMLIETGAYSVQWAPIHGPVLLDDSNKQKPGYYGVQMVHIMAPVPGDMFLPAQSQFPAIGVHAVKRRDGGLGILVVNKDWRQNATVAISISGFNFASKGTRYDYGPAAVDAGKGITESPIENLGSTFTIQVPGYGVVALVIPKA